MPQERSIFRQAALDRLSNPDQLDQMMQVTTPRGWLALIALSGIVAVAVLWSVLGSISTTVSGQGILIKAGGIHDIDVVASGVLSNLKVHEGDTVEKGEIIAHVAQPQLQQQIQQATASLHALRQKRKGEAQYSSANVALEASSLEGQRENLIHQAESLRERIKWLTDQEKAQREALALGVITQAALQSTIQSLGATRNELAQTQIQLKGLQVNKLALSKQGEKSLDGIDAQIQAAEHTLQSLKLQLDQSANVVSPYTGRIQEVQAVPGQLVEPGMAIVSLEDENSPLQAVCFIPMLGKNVSPGMVAQVSPATVKREEYGYMLGRVTSVSGLPATRAGMMRLLNNEILVQQLVKKGAPFTLEIHLEKNPNAPSGFRWSSEKGPPMKVESGTLCQVRIVVKEQRPIYLVVPALRRIFLGEGSPPFSKPATP